MTFPRTARPLGVELYLDGVWSDITDDVDRTGVEITRGRADEASEVEPGTCKFLLTNANGKYSPRNPSSPLYGSIRRNVPVRVWVKAGSTRALQPRGGSYFSAADTAALSITGDFDLRADIDPQSWRPTATAWVGVLKSGSYGMWITRDGYLVCNFTTTAPATVSLTSTEPLPFHVGRHAVRVTLDVDNGAGGKTARFYYADTLSGTWTELGSPVTNPGTATIAGTANALATYTSTELGPTSVYGIEVRNGIGGTIVAAPDFDGATEGTTSLSDGHGNSWVPYGSAEVTARHYRFHGEVTKWPQQWGRKGAPSAIVPIEAAGIIRRLVQGVSPVRSPLFQSLAATPGLAAYWPMEEGRHADRISGYAGGRPVQPFGSLAFAEYSDILAADPLPKVRSALLAFPVPASSQTGQNQVRFVAEIPDSTPDGAILMRVHTASTFEHYDLVYGAPGMLTLKGYTHENVLAVTVGPLTAGSAGPLIGAPIMLSLEVQQAGPNVTAAIVYVPVGRTVGYLVTATTVGGSTLGMPANVIVNPRREPLNDFALGHLTVETAITSVFTNRRALSAWLGEDAADRAVRVSSENGLTLNVLGGGLATQPMGSQNPATALDIVREAAVTDGGVVYEHESTGGLILRTLESMTRQDPGCIITYTDNLLRPFEPVEDDQQTRNVVTVTRAGAGSARVADDNGPMGTAAIGVYDEDVTLSLLNDDATWQQAGWRVNLGSVDEPRWPAIGCDLHDSWWIDRPDVVRDLLTLNIGDRLVVENLPDWLPPFPVDAIVQAVTETITTEPGDILRFGRHTVELTCSPAAPLDTLAYDRGDRWENTTSTLSADVTAGATTLSVAFTAGPYWSHADGDFEIVVGGEVMTVTAVSGTSSPQSFTVTRGVNTAGLPHTAGDAVALYHPARWAL